MFPTTRLSLLAVLAFALAACDDGGSPPPQAAAKPNTQQTAPAEQEGEEKPTFVVFAQPDHPPLTIRSADGQLSGLDIDLLKAIAEVEGFNLNILPHSLNGLLDMLDTGQADIVTGIQITSDKQANFDFSQPYLESGYGVLIPKDSKVKSFADLQGKALSVSQGGTSENQLRSAAITDKIVPTKTLYLAVSELKLGNVAGAYGTTAALGPHLKSNPGYSIVADDKSGKIQFAFAIVKDNGLLKTKLDKGFATIRANGTYQQILNKWTGFSYVQKPDNATGHTPKK